MNLNERIVDILNNEHLIPGYASKKCKDCRGKGIIEQQIPTIGREFQDIRVLCGCVKKALKKEINEFNLG